MKLVWFTPKSRLPTDLRAQRKPTTSEASSRPDIQPTSQRNSGPRRLPLAKKTVYSSCFMSPPKKKKKHEGPTWEVSFELPCVKRAGLFSGSFAMDRSRTDAGSGVLGLLVALPMPGLGILTGRVARSLARREPLASG